MTQTPAKAENVPTQIDLKEVIAHSDWKKDLLVSFNQRASLAIAQWVLYIFAGVYLLAFIATFIMLFKPDATFEKGTELLRFLIQSLIPLVTLAVGFYLGDRRREQSSDD